MIPCQPLAEAGGLAFTDDTGPRRQANDGAVHQNYFSSLEDKAASNARAHSPPDQSPSQAAARKGGGGEKGQQLKVCMYTPVEGMAGPDMIHVPISISWTEKSASTKCKGRHGSPRLCRARKTHAGFHAERGGGTADSRHDRQYVSQVYVCSTANSTEQSEA